MKKAVIYLAIVISLVACSKESQERPQPAAVAEKMTFFSRVRYFKDNRQPGTDTVWTLRMMNQAMVDTFTKYDGKVYWESAIEKEIGRMWRK